MKRYHHRHNGFLLNFFLLFESFTTRAMNEFSLACLHQFNFFLVQQFFIFLFTCSKTDRSIHNFFVRFIKICWSSSRCAGDFTFALSVFYIRLHVRSPLRSYWSCGSVLLSQRGYRVWSVFYFSKQCHSLFILLFLRMFFPSSSIHSFCFCLQYSATRVYTYILLPCFTVAIPRCFE